MTDILSLSGKDLDAEITRIVKQKPQTYRFWTPKEIEILGRLYGRAELRAVAVALGRSTKSVQQKAQELGLTQS